MRKIDICVTISTTAPVQAFSLSAYPIMLSKSDWAIDILRIAQSIS